jgi:hypothetical protein
MHIQVERRMLGIGDLIDDLECLRGRIYDLMWDGLDRLSDGVHMPQYIMRTPHDSPTIKCG